MMPVAKAHLLICAICGSKTPLTRFKNSAASSSILVIRQVLGLQKQVFELINEQRFHLRKIDVLQFIEVVVIGDDILCAACNGAIHKFVIVFVGLNQTESVGRNNSHHVFVVEQNIDGKVGNILSPEPADYLLLLFENIIRDAGFKLSGAKRLPHDVKRTVGWQT